MIKFWANRIEYNLERIEEVPEKLREKVKAYIEEREGCNDAKIY